MGGSASNMNGTAKAISLMTSEYRKRVAAKARFDAQDELPGSNDKRLNDTQQEIRNNCSSLLRDTRMKAMDNLSKEASNRLTITGCYEQIIKDLETEGLTAVSRLKKDREEDLKILIRDRNKRRTELKAFRNENGLGRDASYPKNLWPVYSTFFVMLLIESILNANMLAKTNEYGIVGGWTEAVFISLANILFGLAIGFWPMRYKNHIQKEKRILGLLGVSIYCAGMLLFNFIFAHYRAAADLGFGTGIKAGFESFASNPFAIFFNIQSLSLFMVGVLCSVVACWKGAGLDDSYPGYGAVSRLFKDAENAYISAQKGLYAHLNTIFDSIRSKMRTVEQKANSDVGALAKSLEASERIAVEFSNNAAMIEDGLVTLINLYRETNSAVRDTLPPSYFKEEVIFDATEKVIDLDLSFDSGRLKDIQALLPVLRNLIAERVAVVEGREKNEVDSLKEFFAELEREVLQQIREENDFSGFSQFEGEAL